MGVRGFVGCWACMCMCACACVCVRVCVFAAPCPCLLLLQLNDVLEVVALDAGCKHPRLVCSVLALAPVKGNLCVSVLSSLAERCGLRRGQMVRQAGWLP